MNRTLQIILAGVGLLLLLVGGTAATSSIVINHMATNDKQPRYIGCEAFYDGETPYSQDVVDRIQEFLGPAWTAPYVAPFAYPAHLCVVLAPFWLLPYQVSVSLWVFLNFLGFLVLPMLFLVNVLGWRPRPRDLLLVVVMTMLGYRYTMMTIVLAQYTGFVLFCMSGAIWAIQHKRAWIAALLLAGMTIRPDGTLLALGLCAVAFFNGQKRIPVYWAGMLFVLWLMTTLVVPGWELQFVDEVIAYRSRSGVWLPLLAGRIGLPVILLLSLGWTAFMLRQIREREQFVLWSSAIIIVLGLLLVPHTNPYTLVYAFPVFYLLMYRFQEQRLASALLLGTMLMSWIIFLQGMALFGVEQIFFPLALAGWLTFTVHRATVEEVAFVPQNESVSPQP